jgi:hypothetical protein
LEAVHRDYGPKGVKVFFIYKSLAHPELVGDYVQPFTLDERLEHARQAEKQLGATVPWLVDAMDNRLKHALGDRPNSEFVIDPDGIIVRKRAWSHPAQLRKDLEQLVGPVEHETREADIQLKLQLPLKPAAAKGVAPRIERTRMQAIAIETRIDPKGQPFFAKLRAEADRGLLTNGKGRLYLGFHLDPFHGAHWNNLATPLSIKLTPPAGLKIDKLTAEAAKVEAVSDADPREFLLNVEEWPKGEPLRLTVTYFACVGEESCHAVQQEYQIHLRNDRDAGGARGEGAGYWDGKEFARRMLASDKDGDRLLNKEEVTGLVQPRFAHFDVNQDGLLSPKELTAVADWLNHHHQPGVPASR